MQEEVEQRIVSLMISCGKLGEQEFRKAIGFQGFSFLIPLFPFEEI